MTSLRSSLASHLPRSETTAEELRAMARAAWLKSGVIVLFPDQQIGWLERQAAENAAAKLYGRRATESVVQSSKNSFT